MVIQDRIRLTGLLRKKPWKQGFFYEIFCRYCRTHRDLLESVVAVGGDQAMRLGRQGRIRGQEFRWFCSALRLRSRSEPRQRPPGGGNSGNAKLCQSGWQSWLRADGTPFANQGACVSYTAQGGILTTFTTSTTSHITFTRVDLPTIQAYLTRVIQLPMTATQPTTRLCVTLQTRMR